MSRDDGVGRHRPRWRLSGWWLVEMAILASAAVVLLASCGDDSPSEAAPDTVSVLAGVNDQDDPTVAVTEFLPEAVSVLEGAAVEWRFAGPEPHSVTFLEPGRELPPLDSTEFEEMLVMPATPAAEYDGESFVNSALRPIGPDAAEPFTLSFPAEGSYTYVCLIHPNMTGTVTVVGDDSEADSQADINERANGELNRWLEEGRSAKAALVSSPPAQEANPDGTTTWVYEMGVTTEHTEILAFSPEVGEVRPGDTVRFVNNTQAPHGATFAAGGQVPQNPADPAVDVPTGPPPLTVTPTGGPFNSGLVPPAAPPNAPPPPEARSFAFVLPEAGNYPYVCIYHAPSGMAGSITVA